jgi:hypothetical protein
MAEETVNLTKIRLEYDILAAANSFFGTVRNIANEQGYVPEIDLSEVYEFLYGEKSSNLALESAQMIASLQKARQQLQEVDHILDPAKFRLVFERIGAPSTHSLELVVQYYLSKPEHTKEDRDKVDLLATRWGSYLVNTSQKLPMLRAANDLVSKISELYEALEVTPVVTKSDPEILSTLQALKAEIDDIHNFREVADKQVIGRLRTYKSIIGEKFYLPTVLAEIVEINVEIHNLFQQLYDDEQARLHLYLEEAKKKALTDEQMRHLAQMQPIYRIMGRAVQIEHLIDDIKQALATQQVLDQTVMEKVEQDGAQVQDFTDLLVDTLQTSRKVSDQLHHSLTRLQRLEKLSIVVSVLERQVFENVALKHERSLDELLRSIVEDALIRVAAALEEGQIDHLFPAQTATAELALSELIAKGFLAVD